VVREGFGLEDSDYLPSAQTAADTTAGDAGSPAAGKPIWTLSQVVDNLTRWDQAWTGAGPIAYSFFDATPSYDTGWTYYQGFSPFSADQRAAAQLALQLISDVANVSFVQVPDNGSRTGRIDFADSSTMPGYAWGWTTIGSGNSQVDGRYPVVGSETWVNTSSGVGSYAPGSYNLMALIHEISHSMGLAHPGDYDASQGPVSYSADAAYAQDSRQYTVMSYFDASNTGADHGAAYAATPLLHDVAALQALYGANTATRASDTVYGFHSTADRSVFDFSQNPHPVVTIWDGGGNDTIDLSGFTTSSVLDLGQGAFSSVGGLTDNLSIAFGAVIENGIGGAGNDSLTGNAGANLLEGGGGDDILAGDGGADTLDGGPGNDTAVFAGPHADYAISVVGGIATVIGDGSTDTLIGVEKLAFADGTIDVPGAGAATVTGTASNDVLTGTPGSDVLQGLGGDDVLQGGPGDDTLDGGAGTDNAFYASAPSGVTVSLALQGQAQDTHGAGNDTLIGIENLYGSAFGDTLTGDDGANSILGNGGADVLNGAGGDDYLMGGPGNDTIDGGSGVDTAAFSGARAGYSIANVGGVITVTGPDGTDTLTNIEKLAFSDQTIDAPAPGHVAANSLSGTAGNDYLVGGTGDDALSGLAGDDVLQGGPGADTLDGGAGTDNAFYDNATSGVTVNLATSGPQDTGGAGTDTLISIENLYGSPFGDHLTGDDGANSILGNGGSDVLMGAGGDDYLMGGPGDDTLDGGAGTDTAVFSGARSSYIITSGAGALTVSGPDGTDVLTNIEKLAFSDQTVDAASLGGGGAVPGATLNGTAGNDFLVGTGGDDHISGLAGDDVLRGGAGNDTLDGGPGTDNAFYDDASSGVTVSLAVSGPQDTGGAGTDTLVSIENLYGSSFGDTLTGDDGSNSILGNGGNDVLNGGGGNDYLMGGPGADTIDGGDGIDTAVFSGPLASYSVVANAGTVTVSGPDGTDTLTNVEKLAFADQTIDAPGAVIPGIILSGASGNDVLTGGAGDDALSGLGGDDILRGGAGNDTLDGGSGTDNAFYDTASAGVTVDLSLAGSAQNTVGAGSDTLISIENLYGSPFSDVLIGDAGPNSLSGAAGDDTLSGGDGADVLYGGAGSDHMAGGAGNDMFLYLSLADSPVGAPDQISDFAAGDRINLAPIDADPNTAGDQAFQIGDGTHAGDIVISAYDAAHDRTVVDLYTAPNVIGAEIWLSGDHAGLTAADFVL
jgi:serralysin